MLNLEHVANQGIFLNVASSRTLTGCQYSCSAYARPGTCERAVGTR